MGTGALTRKVKVVPTKVKQWARPVTLTLTAYFSEGSRKVTPSDLEKASIAAVQAFRTSLESRTPAYDIAEIEGEVSYFYLQSRKKVTG